MYSTCNMAHGMRRIFRLQAGDWGGLPSRGMAYPTPRAGRWAKESEDIVHNKLLHDMCCDEQKKQQKLGTANQPQNCLYVYPIYSASTNANLRAMLTK